MKVWYIRPLDLMILPFLVEGSTHAAFEFSYYNKIMAQ